MEWSTPRTGRFTPGKETRYPIFRRLGGPQSQSARVRKISPLTGIRSPDRPARSESLYRLSYPGPWKMLTKCLLRGSTESVFTSIPRNVLRIHNQVNRRRQHDLILLLAIPYTIYHMRVICRAHVAPQDASLWQLSILSTFMTKFVKLWASFLILLSSYYLYFLHSTY